MTAMIEDKQWEIETQWRAGQVAEFFKPKEILLIQSFIETARKEREREAVA